jgi:hypothetical protein
VLKPCLLKVVLKIPLNPAVCVRLDARALLSVRKVLSQQADLLALINRGKT